ncbi:hypothetical protein D6D01_10424, partial [Aureobasidium pullulans]
IATQDLVWLAIWQIDLVDQFSDLSSTNSVNISRLITPKLKSLELVGFNTRHFILALSQVTHLQTLRFKPLSDSNMGFLPNLSCCPALKTLEFNDRVRG